MEIGALPSHYSTDGTKEYNVSKGWGFTAPPRARLAWYDCLSTAAGVQDNDDARFVPRASVSSLRLDWLVVRTAESVVI